MLNSADDTLHIFVDEAGDPTLFANRRRAIVGTEGCSRYFILGKLEVDDPAGLGLRLEALRRQLLDSPYFGGVPSFNPERGKTVIAFRAKDDLPEVRYEVFKLLAAEGGSLLGKFHRLADWKIRVSTPKSETCLQAVDYFLWAVQRFYEPRLDEERGASKRDERFLKVVWPQVGEIHDMHFGGCISMPKEC